MTEDDQYKSRFLLFAATRLGGLALMGIGVAAAFSDLVRDGGSRQFGGLLIAIGTIELVAVPLILKRIWDKK